MTNELAVDCPNFLLIEFNERRRSRGAPAARVQVDDDGGWLWMTKRDLELNMRDFGKHPELIKAVAHYTKDI